MRATRRGWLLEQIEKCDELLESGKLTEFQNAMVTVLRLNFKEDLQTLRERKDDGDEGCCNVIHLPRREA